jgi:putative sterol carrier protein
MQQTPNTTTRASNLTFNEQPLPLESRILTTATMSLVNSKFPSSQAFDVINNYLESDVNERSAIVKQTKTSFGIVLKKDDETASWTIDLKDKGEVRSGIDEKPTVTLAMNEDIFEKLVSGQANAQKLFMAGKIKITGDMMKSTKLEPVLKKIQVKAKL